MGLISDFAYYQQNGKSIIDNYIIQKQQQQRKNDIEQAKKQIHQQILNAILYTMNEGTDKMAAAAASNIINSVHAAFGSGSAKATNQKAVSEDLGAILGKALGDAPFKAIDEMFDATERRY